MELEKAFQIAEDFLVKKQVAHLTPFINSHYRPKGTMLPGGVLIDEDEWSFCFIRKYEEEDVISTDAAVIVIVDVKSKAARYL
jgi:hypothetical protein